VNENLVPALVWFVRSVAVLALPAEDQVRWLNSIGFRGESALADELAMEFDDGFRLLPQFVEHGWIPAAAAGKLGRLDSLLAAMSGPENVDVWHVSALAHADAWAAVRQCATSVLLDL
jgi:hypothetical protein